MAATGGGAFEYLAKPFEMAHMVDIIRRAEKDLISDDDEIEPDGRPPETEMIGSSPRMMEIYKTISRVAPTDATVLIEGETGTGKELIARMIHVNSARASASLRAGRLRFARAIPARERTLRHAEGSLHRRRRDRIGVFEAANGGTVFLDEIGDIDLDFQLKLLRFLQERRSARSARAAAQGGRARHRRHQQRCAEAGRRGQVPRGPLVPA